MQTVNRHMLGWLLLAGLVTVALAGCQTHQPIVIVEGAEETQAAATAFFVGQTATAEIASLPTTPTPTSTPYIRPTDDPAVDPDTVIATVAGHDITVREFRNRVRYERWSVLETLRRVAEISGLSAIDIRDPSNPMTPTVIGYLYTLADAEGFAEQVLDLMIQERIIHQEFVARQLPPNSALLNNLWMRLLQIEPSEDDSQLPDDFNERLEAFMAELAPYTDITEVDLRFILTVHSEQQTLAQIIGAEAEIDPEALQVRHILVETEEEAQEIINLLEEGADFDTLARERSIDPGAQGNGGDLGFFERGDMVPAFEQAVFSGEPGDLIGPVRTEYGYHVVEVLDREDEIRGQRILVSTETEADEILARLASGEDFDTLREAYSLESGDGDMGFVPVTAFPLTIQEQVRVADIGDVLGPVETSDGFNVIRLTDRRALRIRARHILVGTEAEAQEVMDRLSNGEDFAALAQELSLDPGAQGNGGELGFVTSDQLPEPLAEALHAAQTGEIVGPIETEYGYDVAQVTDRRPTVLTPDQYDELRALHFQNWLRRQKDAVEINDIWREAYPSDPRPADMTPYLGELEAAMNTALEAMATPSAASE